MALLACVEITRWSLGTNGTKEKKENCLFLHLKNCYETYITFSPNGVQLRMPSGSNVISTKVKKEIKKR